ncbi:MAG: hypothetical protein KY468_20815 [Armatimonadetes bacterium]|nr:hypothetical protein [Armatimonadota bacterium]
MLIGEGLSYTRTTVVGLNVSLHQSVPFLEGTPKEEIMHTFLRILAALFLGFLGLIALWVTVYFAANRDFQLISGTGIFLLLVVNAAIFCFWAAGRLVYKSLREP